MTFSSLMPELILMPKTQCLSLFTMAEECSIMLRVRIKLTLYLPNVIYEYYEGVKRTLSPAVTANFLELVLTDGTFHEFVICWVVMAYSTWIFFYTDCRTWWSSVITCAGSFFIYFFFFSCSIKSQSHQHLHVQDPGIVSLCWGIKNFPLLLVISKIQSV